MLAGDPGIGKSALAAETARRATALGAMVLTTTGVQSETRLAYAGLHQLLWPVIDEARRLPLPQREALHAALGLAGGAVPDEYLTGLAVLGLLGDVAERRPLLAVIEDAHWLDQPTMAALGFVARRLRDDPVGLLITTRGDPPRALRSAGVRVRRIEPLDDTASAALLDARAGELTPAVRKAILARAEGNPLALVELPSQAGGAEAGTAVPLTARLERTFAARAADLPATTRTVLLVAALNDGDSAQECLAATATIVDGPVGLEQLEPAIAAGLVTVDEAELRFRHPLIRSALQQTAATDDRHRAHAALASILAAEPARRIWQQVAASSGHDKTLATELDAMAAGAQRRGSIVTAVDVLTRAAQLSADHGDRGRRLLAAAELALEIGRLDLVAPLLADASDLPLASDDRERCAWLFAMTDADLLADDRLGALLDRAELQGDDGDGSRAAQALLTVAFRCWWAAPPQATRDRLVATTARLLPARHPIATMILALADPIGQGATIADRLAGAPLNQTPPELQRLLAVAAAIVGDFDRAASLADDAVQRLRDKGRYGLLAPALVARAWAGVFAGGWPAALVAAEEARRVALETDQELWAVSACAAAGVLTAFRGDAGRARALADEARRLLRPGIADGMGSLILLARAAADMAEDRHADALALLARVLDAADPDYSPFVACWSVAPYTDAALACGQPDAVRVAITRVAPIAEAVRSPHLTAAVAYARGAIAEGEEAEATLDAALAATLPVPLLHARTQLARGAWLRRAWRVPEARAALRAAREGLEALGADALAERARGELRAAGEVSHTRVADPGELLTPQELRIAELAAQGLSNREIGQALYLSHRTIGSHLYRIFPKVGVVSRTELAALFSPPAGAPPGSAPAS